MNKAVGEIPQRNHSQGEQKQTILIVEDELLLSEAIAATLDMEGLHTITTHDGMQALKLARALVPDLVILDLMLPGKSGIEVCATLKTNATTASIPVIIVTAKAEKEDRAVGLAAGADAYVTKPFSPVKLIALVRKMLSGEPVEDSTDEPVADSTSEEQLVVYAHDLRNLFLKESLERQELEVARRRLEELDDLKASFLSTVTHELMTPFAPIGLALQVLQRQSADLQPSQLQALDDLTTEIAGLHRLVSGVVKFASLVNKRRDPQPGYISLSQVIPWAVQPVAVLSEARNVDFRVFVSPELPRVLADPELLGEAVFQMAHNAIKFTQSGGRAQIRASVSEDWLTIEVKDSGIGMEPAQLTRLGMPFEQSIDALRRGREGLGIGWTFVRYVAEVHNGKTHVASPGPGKGSTFTLALPLITETKPDDEN